MIAVAMHADNWISILRSGLMKTRRSRRQSFVSKIEPLDQRLLLTAPHPLELSSLSEPAGFRIDGLVEDDNFGSSVSDAGDMNGDGYDDFIIGAARVRLGQRGRIYVVFGDRDGFPSTFDLASLDGTNGFRLDPVGTNDETGWSVSHAGDVNGDGLSDIIVGGRLNAHAPTSDQTDASYVVFGKSTAFPSVLSLASLDGTNGFLMDGAGLTVSGAGDMNGDGFDDVVVSRTLYGDRYVVFGKSHGFMPAIDLAALDGTNGFRLYGPGLDPISSNVGDFNNDGLDDIVVSSQYATFLVYGSTAFDPTVNAYSLTPAEGLRINAPNDRFSGALAVSGAGDVNGDGFDDLIVGRAVRVEPGVIGSGTSYVLFGTASGSTSIDLKDLNGQTGFRIDGVKERGNLGFSVSHAGDLNGDGYDDIIIGGYDRASPDGVGESFVVFGKSSGYPSVLKSSDLNGSNGFEINGFGYSVSTAGDLNGDGYDDVIIGAPTDVFDSPGDLIPIPTGASFVVFGGNFTGGAETQQGDEFANTLTAVGGSAVDVLIGAQGDDILISDGGNDVLRGGQGNDVLAIPDADFGGTRRIEGGNGFDTVRIDGNGIDLDLTIIPNNRIVDIEQFDITGSGSNTLTLNVLEVLSISEYSNTVLVHGDVDDSVQIGPGWIRGADEQIASDVFAVFTQDAATVKVKGAAVVGSRDTIGVYRSSLFYHDANGNGLWGGTVTGDVVSRFDAPGTPLVGDWNGDGIDNVGIHIGPTFYLDANGNGTWDGTAGGDIASTFGSATDTPIIGDWNGDGIDFVGVHRGRRFYRDVNGNGVWDGPTTDAVSVFGIVGDTPIVGDWNGDGTDSIGIHRGHNFYRDLDGNGLWDGVSVDAFSSFGIDGDVPVVGDWNGDGVDSIGIKRSEKFYRDVNGNGIWDGSSTDAFSVFDVRSATPISGDWDGNGTDEIGVHRDGNFYLDTNSDGHWDSEADDVATEFRNPTGTPLVGDWNGDGYDEIGLHIGKQFYLDVNGNGVWDGDDAHYSFGIAGATPIIGDWDGDGIDSIGNHSGREFFLDLNGNGAWDGPAIDSALPFGIVGDTPVIGDWNGDGVDAIGVHRGREFLRDLTGNGVWDGPSIDVRSVFGNVGDTPLVGDWNGDGTDSIGVHSDRSFSRDETGNGVWDGPSLDVRSVFGIAGDVPIVGQWRPGTVAVPPSSATFFGGDDSAVDASGGALNSFFEVDSSISDAFPQGFEFSLDFDGDHRAQSLSDGILLTRFLAGFTGESLVAGAVNATGTRTDAAEIVALLSPIRETVLDIDGDGRTSALTDGILMMRYLAGFTGDALIADAVNLEGVRTTVPQIQEWLKRFASLGTSAGPIASGELVAGAESVPKNFPEALVKSADFEEPEAGVAVESESDSEDFVFVAGAVDGINDELNPQRKRLHTTSSSRGVQVDPFDLEVDEFFSSEILFDVLG